MTASDNRHPLEAPTFPWTTDPTQTPQHLVHTSCSTLAHSATTHVHINTDKLRQYALSLQPATLHKPQLRQLPLVFTLEGKVNFYSLMAILQFGSGYRTQLHAATGRGASDVILTGMLSMHISTPSIGADYLASLSLHEVATLFGLPITEEYEIRPGITSERRSTLYPLADNIRRVCNECGATLRALQCSDFSDFVLRRYVRPQPFGLEPTASLLKRLLTHFPSLRDWYDIDSNVGRVYVLKRAQLLVADLAAHCTPAADKPAHLTSPLLAFETSSLGAFADNVVPCVLHAVGVMEWSDELSSRVERGDEIKEARVEAELRGLAVWACDEMVRVRMEAGLHSDERKEATTAVVAQESKEQKSAEGKDGAAEEASVMGKLTAADLGYHIWQQGKEEHLRKLPRPATKNTVFY